MVKNLHQVEKGTIFNGSVLLLLKSLPPRCLLYQLFIHLLTEQT